MLKFIGRFMVVLAVSILLAVGTYALVQRNSSALGITSQFRGPEGQFTQDRQSQGSTAGAGSTNSGVIQGGQGTGFREREHDFEGRRGSGMGILKNLAVFALITLAVLGLQKLISLLKGRRTVKPAPIGG